MFATWLYKRKDFKDKHFYDTTEVVSLYVVPRMTINSLILLIIFIFIEVSKYHLLWLYPVIYIITAFLMSKRVLKQDENNL